MRMLGNNVVPKCPRCGSKQKIIICREQPTIFISCTSECCEYSEAMSDVACSKCGTLGGIFVEYDCHMSEITLKCPKNTGRNKCGHVGVVRLSEFVFEGYQVAESHL